jgi:hypothetical protein
VDVGVADAGGIELYQNIVGAWRASTQAGRMGARRLTWLRDGDLFYS